MHEDPDTIGAAGYERLRRATRTHREDLLLRLCGEAGLRPAEMARLRADDTVAHEGHYFLVVRGPSGGVDREAYLPSAVEHDLRKYANAADRSGEDPVFDVSARRLQMLLGEIGDRASESAPRLADVSPRDLRMRFAASLLERGVPVAVVRELGGWASLDPLEPLLSEPDRAAVAAAMEGDRRGALPSLVAALADLGGRLSTLGSVAAVERSVCTRLAEADAVPAVWVAEPTGDGLARRASAGMDPEAADSQVSALEGTVREVLDVGTAATVGGRDGPVVVLPVSPDGPATRAVGVGIDGPPAGAVVDVLAALSGLVGAALAAVERKRLLVADSVTELRFRSTSDAAFAVGLSAACDCRVELTGLVPSGGDSLLYYLGVDGAGADTVLSYAREHDAVADARLIEDYGDGCHVEVAVTAAPTMALLDGGARVRDLRTEDGRATIDAELPADADVRETVSAVVDAFPGTSLVAKYETDRSAETATGFRLSERLSEKQATALRAAYHAGYFEWPRDSTAEELANSLGVSSPTLHNHLRVGQGKLLAAVFEEDRREFDGDDLSTK